MKLKKIRKYFDRLPRRTRTNLVGAIVTLVSMVAFLVIMVFVAPYMIMTLIVLGAFYLGFAYFTIRELLHQMSNYIDNNLVGYD